MRLRTALAIVTVTGALAVPAAALAQTQPTIAEELEMITASFADYVDSDGDGASDAAERTFGTDPHDPDSDDDGVSDGDELAGGLGVKAGDPAIDDAAQAQAIAEAMRGAAAAQQPKPQEPASEPQPAEPVDPHPGMTFEEHLRHLRLEAMKEQMARHGITDEMIRDGFTQRIDIVFEGGGRGIHVYEFKPATADRPPLTISTLELKWPDGTGRRTITTTDLTTAKSTVERTTYDGSSTPTPTDDSPPDDSSDTPPDTTVPSGTDSSDSSDSGSDCPKGNTCISTSYEKREDGVTVKTETKTDETGNTTTTTTCFSHDSSGNEVVVPCDNMPNPEADECDLECQEYFQRLGLWDPPELELCLIDCPEGTPEGEGGPDFWQVLTEPGVIDPPRDGGDLTGPGEFEPQPRCQVDCPQEQPEGPDGPINDPNDTGPVSNP